MITLRGVPPEEVKLFLDNIDNAVLMRRAQSIVAQKKAAKLMRAAGGQRVVRGKLGTLVSLPKANIDPTYYTTRMNQEREANDGRMASGENVWSDPEFIDYELRQNPELRPVINDANAPVHMNGIILPTAANFKQAKAAQA